MTPYPLGRIEQFDDRSRAYPIRALVGTARPPRSYTWKCDVALNQGTEGTCVGHAWAHEIAARPNPWPATSGLALSIYREATRIDPWPQNDTGPDMSFGTSVLAGATVAHSWGFYREYRWAFGLDDVVMALGYAGPVVLGVPWHNDMFDPDANGMLHVGGGGAGGHAILANGVDVRRRVVRLKNSWGAGWGLNSEAFISYSDLNTLLQDNGEACVPVR